MNKLFWMFISKRYKKDLKKLLKSLLLLLLSILLFGFVLATVI